MRAPRASSLYSRPANTESVPESESKQQGSLRRSISGTETFSLNSPHLFASEPPETLWIVIPKPTSPGTRINIVSIPSIPPTLSQGPLKCVSVPTHDGYITVTTYQSSVSKWQPLQPLSAVPPLALNLSPTEPIADASYLSVSAHSGESSAASSLHCSFSRFSAISPTTIPSLSHLVKIEEMREQRRSRPKPLLPPVTNDLGVKIEERVEDDDVLSPDSYQNLVNQYHSLATPLHDQWEGEEEHNKLIPVPLFWENKQRNPYPKRWEHTHPRTPIRIRRQKTRKEISSSNDSSKMTYPSWSAPSRIDDNIANSRDRLPSQLRALIPHETRTVESAGPHGMGTSSGTNSTHSKNVSNTAFDRPANKKQLRETAVIDRQIPHTDLPTTVSRSPSSYEDIPAIPNRTKLSPWSHVLRKARSSLIPRDSTPNLEATKQMDKLRRRNEMKATIRVVPGLVDLASLYEAEQESRIKIHRV